MNLIRKYKNVISILLNIALFVKHKKIAGTLEAILVFKKKWYNYKVVKKNKKTPGGSSYINIGLRREACDVRSFNRPFLCYQSYNDIYAVKSQRATLANPCQ